MQQAASCCDAGGIAIAIPKLSYVICTAPRTGSSLLCAALTRTALAGRPAEYFDIHAHNEAHWTRQLAIQSDGEYVTKVLHAGTSDNGVFGLKLHWHQSPALIAKLLAEPAAPASDLTGPDRMDALLRQRLGDVRYIWLRRKNLVAQAISYYRASKTDFWRLPANAAQPAGSAVNLPFDYEAIGKYVQDVQRFEQAWHGFFMRRKLRALIVIYERFIETYAPTVRGVLDYLGLDGAAAPIVAPQFRQQADEISAEWERRYRERASGKTAAPRYTPGRRRPPRAARAEPVVADLPLIAYDLGSGVHLPIAPAPPGRPWMDAVPQRFVYRCLPLVIANQAGWLIRNSHRLSAWWNGKPGLDAVHIRHDTQGQAAYASSHFGSGILTFSVGLLFRTPPGYNLLVRGPTNWPKDGICALDGIVETDWSRATFTMNWKFTRPDHEVIFEVGEPIAMVAPLPRNNFERFRPQLQPIGTDKEWETAYHDWARSRSEFNKALQAREPEAVAAGWQRHYLLGVTVGDKTAPEHQTGLALAPFEDLRPRRG